MFLDITKDCSELEHARQQLESALKAAWDTIDKESFDTLYQSMAHRIEYCGRRLAHEILKPNLYYFGSIVDHIIALN